MAGAKQNRFRPDALCDFERRILDLWDGGASMQRIARELKLKRATVGRVVRYYTEGDARLRHRREMARSNATFVAALRAAS